MKIITKFIQLILLIFSLFVILFAFYNRSIISHTFLATLEESNVSFAWILVFILLVSFFLIFKNWGKIKNYNNLNTLDTIEMTILIIMPFIFSFALVMGLFRGDF